MANGFESVSPERMVHTLHATLSSYMSASYLTYVCFFSLRDFLCYGYHRCLLTQYPNTVTKI